MKCLVADIGGSVSNLNTARMRYRKRTLERFRTVMLDGKT